MWATTLFFERKLSFLLSLNILNFFDFESSIRLKFCLSVKDIVLPESERNIIKSLLMFTLS